MQYAHQTNLLAWKRRPKNNNAWKASGAGMTEFAEDFYRLSQTRAGGRF
jgi:hypothetical protein